MLTLSLLAPLVMSASTATASATFSNHPITSTYTSPGQVTTAGGSLWYLEVDPGATPYSVYDIGNMTTSGTVTNYNIRTLSGKPNLLLSSVTTGPDGNVWFDGYQGYGSNALVGVLNISTGTVTTYTGPIQSSDLPGNIVTGSDGNLYYVVFDASTPYYTHLLYVNPSTGTTTNAWTFNNANEDITSLASGPDGKLWMTDYTNNTIRAVPPVGGTGYYLYHLPTGDTEPGNIISGPDGNLWLTAYDGTGGSTYYILKLTTGGTFTAYIQYGSGLAAGPDGAVWFVDITGKKIGRISSSGSVTEYAIPGSYVSNVTGLTTGPDDAVWFSYQDSAGPKLGRLGY